MGFILRIIIIAALCYLTKSLLPWWSIALVAFCVSAIWRGSSANAFLAGFLGVGLLWFGVALYYSTSYDSPLPDNVADLFQMGSSEILATVTGLIGAIVGGLASLSGSYFNNLISKRAERPRY